MWDKESRTDILLYESEGSICGVKKRYQEIRDRISQGQGCYIWGTGKLGMYCLKQLEKKSIRFNGFIDNDQSRLDDGKKIYSPEKLRSEDIVIVASFYYPQIIRQLKKMGNIFGIYYEEFAYAVDGCDTYYSAFDGIFDELEKNREEYDKIFDVLSDDISREVYENLLRFRMTLNHEYAIKAMNVSLQHGIQDFDELVVKRINQNTCFYDVGGFDGQTTWDFISRAPDYKKIYFFEPDEKVIEISRKRLGEYTNIEFLPVVVGDRQGKVCYNAIGGGAGQVDVNGTEIVQMVSLDDYIHDPESYIKLDVEGFELSVLEGCENAIKLYKPMLSVSVYHKPGDIHTLINRVLSWNPDYKVYLRHYTETYADTRAYFIDDSALKAMKG